MVPQSLPRVRLPAQLRSDTSYSTVHEVTFSNHVRMLCPSVPKASVRACSSSGKTSTLLNEYGRITRRNICPAR